MNIDTAANPVKITLDTNIIISAMGFGGKPREILQLALHKKLTTVTSPTLLAEFEDVIAKKFPRLEKDFWRINKQIKKTFKIVKPKIPVNVVKDEADNRVLEAALEGKCQYIVTGDKELLSLGSFKKIKILPPDVFLKVMEKKG